MNVLFAPDWRQGVPYQSLLADALVAVGVHVDFLSDYKRVFPLTRLLQQHPADLLHLHWPEAYYPRKRDWWDGFRRARFVPDRLGGQPGGRLYRTGDLGALRLDGQIMFHGRIDTQEKIRGHRVEPAEIAGVLSGHRAVQSCAVAARTGKDGEKQLVAYIVPDPAAPPTAEEVRGFLAGQLPDYMIPARFVRLDVLPLTANGKLDRAALPEPNCANGLDRNAACAPGTPTERHLLAIVTDILGRDDIGVDDNFFLIGGHSLMGAQIVLRARADFGVELTLLQLFEARTIGTLAMTIEQLIEEAVESMSEEEARRLATK